MNSRTINAINAEQAVMVSVGTTGIGAVIAETFLAHDYVDRLFSGGNLGGLWVIGRKE